jgi:hypothetical protein
MEDENGPVRFTCILPADVAAALDAHCEEQARRATSLLRAKTDVSRNKAIEAILRDKFKLPAA